MSFLKDYDHLKIQMKDILSATNNFDSAKVIGGGGFGRVYKGELSLPEGPIMVAFKKLDRRLGQGNIEFWKEVVMLSKCKHENLISLMYYCIEGDEMILGYEYASRGSLDRYLSDASLTWTHRLKICVGAARGLYYLHDPRGEQQRVLHRDIKSGNILLDENWMAKVSDFGLSKIGPANQAQTVLVSNAVGTLGYCDPLYWEMGFLSKESDVYSFGVVLFEILCGRLCCEYNKKGELTSIFVPKWRRCYEEKALDEIIFPGLKEQMDPGSLDAFSVIAYQCVKKAREERPMMAEVVKKLEFALQQQDIFEVYSNKADFKTLIKIADDAKDEKPVDQSSLGVSETRGHTSNFPIGKQEGLSLSQPDAKDEKPLDRSSFGLSEAEGQSSNSPIGEQKGLSLSQPAAKDEKLLDGPALGMLEIKSDKSKFHLEEQEGVSLSRTDAKGKKPLDRFRLGVSETKGHTSNFPIGEQEDAEDENPLDRSSFGVTQTKGQSSNFPIGEQEGLTLSQPAAKDEKLLDRSALGVSEIKSDKSNFHLEEQEGVSLSHPGGALLGAAFGELLKVVIEQTSKTARFKSLLKRLQRTLERIVPRLNETKNSIERLGHTEREIEVFISDLDNAKELVRKCPEIQVWNVYKKFVYANKLIRLEDELLRFFHMDVPLSTLNASLRVENQVKILSERVDRALSLGPLSDTTTRAGGFSGSCGVPGLPDLIIGLDQHLIKLKCMLLMEDTRVLVVSAPGGCGKTTLVKMLCHDDEIKGIFGENIIYVTVSQSPNLENIAQKLFDHFGENHSSFQSEEDAKNQLEKLFRKMGSDNMLLVLDDVWDGSESIVQDLKFRSTGLFKILVTSRSSFPRFSQYELSLLNENDATTLLSYSAFPEDGIPNVPADLVNKMVKSCKGLPLALTVVGASLRGQPRVKWEATLKKWSDGQSILQSYERLLRCLQTSIDALDELPNVKECFLDLGSFPEDDKIAGTALLDMWVELYGLDNEGMYASENLLDLSLRNLVNLVPISKDATDIEGYCREHYVTQHDLLRELAIHLNDQKPIAERKRLFLEIHRDDLPKWWIEQTEHPINARIISISTDEAFSSCWYDLDAPYADVLILNIRSNNYSLPQFIKKMSQLKVLIVTGYGVYPTKIGNLHYLGSLTNLRRIRFEHISFSPSIQVIFTLQNLKKVTFVTCEIGNALKSGATEYPYMLPNLIDLEIDRCYDLKELPAELCRFVHLEKLSITNCHELDDLPIGLGSLSNLQTLRLHCCTKLQQLPESIGNLYDLSLIDISDCLSISALPEQIGELRGLRVLKISGCQGLLELPVSMSKLSRLEDVICNEETSYLWKSIQSEDSKVKINIVEEDRLGNFMKICQ